MSERPEDSISEVVGVQIQVDDLLDWLVFQMKNGWTVSGLLLHAHVDEGAEAIRLQIFFHKAQGQADDSYNLILNRF